MAQSKQNKLTEADFHTALFGQLSCVFPGLKRQNIQNETQITYSVPGGASSTSTRGRSDILLNSDGINLAVIELKAPGKALTKANQTQVVKYCNEIAPPCRLGILSNGMESKFIDATTGNPWVPETDREREFQLAFRNAAAVAAGKFDSVIDAVYGTDAGKWISKFREVSERNFGLHDMATGTFVYPRGAGQQLWDDLNRECCEKRLYLLKGPTLSGKTSVLHWIYRQTQQLPHTAMLYTGSDERSDIFESVAATLSRMLPQDVSANGAHRWLKRVSHDSRSKLIIAIDGFNAWDADAVSAINVCLSEEFGPNLNIVIALDESSHHWLCAGRNGKGPSAIGRDSKTYELPSKLSFDEFWEARELVRDAYRVDFLRGSEYAPEYRYPWIFSSVVEEAAATHLYDGDNTLCITSMPGLEILQRARKHYGASNVLFDVREIATSMLSELTDPEFPHELKKSFRQSLFVRRTKVSQRLSETALHDLSKRGVIFIENTPGGESLVNVRWPDMMLSELATMAARSLKGMIDSKSSNISSWIKKLCEDLPSGALIGAQAMCDLIQADNNYGAEVIEIIENLMEDAPAQPQLNTQKIDGSKRHVVHAESRPDYQCFLMLSYLANIAMRWEEPGAEYPSMRLDAILMEGVGALPSPLMHPERSGVKVLFFPGDVCCVCPSGGIVEPITEAIHHFFKDERDGIEFQGLVMSAVQEPSLPLLWRIFSALCVAREAVGFTELADKFLIETIMPAIEAAGVLDAQELYEYFLDPTGALSAG